MLNGYNSLHYILNILICKYIFYKYFHTYKIQNGYTKSGFNSHFPITFQSLLLFLFTVGVYENSFSISSSHSLAYKPPEIYMDR